MADHSVDYHHIALMQIDSAIEHYLKESISGHVCAITLAGAAEEILGTLLKNTGKKHFLDTLIDKMLAEYPEMDKKSVIDAANLYRNGFKHLKEEICEEGCDLELHARVMVWRAVSNYIELANQKTEMMDKFFGVIEEMKRSDPSTTLGMTKYRAE